MSNLARWRSLIPDTPETLEARSLALMPGTVAHPFGDDGVLLVDRDRVMASLYGTVDFEAFALKYRDLELHCEVVAPARMSHEMWSTAGLTAETAILRRLAPEGMRRPAPRPEVRIGLLNSHDLELIDDEDLRGELAFELHSNEVWCAYVDNRPASFAYAASQTEQFADISVDTVESHRGRGLGAIVVARLVDELIAVGKQPIWGAVVSNAASHSLARRLGFIAPAGELLVLTPHDS